MALCSLPRSSSTVGKADPWFMTLGSPADLYPDQAREPGLVLLREILCIDERMREIVFSQELNNCFLDERTQHLALVFDVFCHVVVTVCFVPAVMLTY